MQQPTESQINADIRERIDRIRLEREETMAEYNQALAKREPAPMVSAESLAKVLGKGDIGSLSERQKVEFLEAVSDAAGLNPLLHPFEFIAFPKGGTKLYFTVEGADQIIGKHKLSVDYSPVHEDKERQLVMQWATVSDGERSVKAVGIINTVTAGMKYEDILMKLESKCRRRAVKAFGGLSLIDDLSQSEEDATTVVNIRPAEAPALSAGDDEPLPFEPEPDPELGVCDWHNAVFTDLTPAGAPIHPMGGGPWCNGQVIAGKGGVILAERKPEAPEPDLSPDDYPADPFDKGSEAYQAAHNPKGGEERLTEEDAATSSSADHAANRLEYISDLRDVGQVNLWLNRVEGATETDALHGRAKILGLTWDAEIGQYSDTDGLPF